MNLETKALRALKSSVKFQRGSSVFVKFKLVCVCNISNNES